MSASENLLFTALAQGKSLAEALEESGMDESEQRRLLPTILAAATVLKFRADLGRGISASPEMLHLFREVTAPIVEAVNDQESEMTELREDMKRLRQVHTDFRDAVTDLTAMVLALKVTLGGSEDQPDRSERSLKVVGGTLRPNSDHDRIV